MFEIILLVNYSCMITSSKKSSFHSIDTETEKKGEKTVNLLSLLSKGLKGEIFNDFIFLTVFLP